MPLITDITSNMTGTGINSYQEVSQSHTYETDNGYAIMPIASREPGFRRIRLHGGLGFRRVKWRSARSGVPPIIPTPTDTLNDLIVSSTVTPSLPRADPNNAGYNWDVEGEYLYVQVYPRQAGTDALPTGGYPFPVAPNDALAMTIIEPIVDELQQAGTLPELIDNLAIIQAGDEGVNHLNDAFRWPFTSLAPIFTSSDMIGN